MVRRRDDYKFSIGAKLKNKPSQKARLPKDAYTEFRSYTGRIEDLLSFIKLGQAWSGAIFKNNKRNKKNIIACGVWGGDIDNAGVDANGEKVYTHQMTLGEARAHPILSKYAILATSPSHSEQWHRFRIIIPLPCEVSPDIYEQISDWVDENLEGVLDKGAKEAGRLFYGNEKAEIFNAESHQCLPPELIARFEEKEKATVRKRRSKPPLGKDDLDGRISAKASELEKALAVIPSDDRKIWIDVGLALKAECDDAEGLRLYQQWSAKASTYEGAEDVEKTWNSFNPREITAGSIFKLAREYGYKPTLAPEEEEEKRKEILLNYEQNKRTEGEDLDLYSVVPERLAKTIYAVAVGALSASAKEIPTAPEAILTASLPTYAAAIGTKSRAVIKPSAKYTQPAILRTCIIAKSGEKKSPVISLATSGVEELERLAQAEYRLNEKDYSEEMRQYEALGKEVKKKVPPPEKPVQTRYLIKDSNIDSIIDVHQDNLVGLLAVVDELAGYFRRMNKYNNGKGDDQERDLELFNGASIIKDRVSYRIYLPRTALSITGGLQWETFKRLMKEQAGEDDATGLLARWLICAKPMPPGYLDLFSENKVEDFTELQRDIFIYLKNLPEQDYPLSFEASFFLQEWQHELVDKRKVETLEPMAIAYPKFESYGFRLALVLHLVDGFFTGEIPPTISPVSAKRAINLTNWHIGQYRYVLARCCPQDAANGALLLIEEFLEKKGFCTPSRFKDHNHKFKHLSDLDFATYFDILVKKGIAVFSEKHRRGLRIEVSSKATARTQNPNFTNGSGQPNQ